MVSTPEASRRRQSNQMTAGSPERPPGDSPAPVSRVCDNCIRKKVKCDQARPTCARCFQRGYSCAYSSIRRKPGPPPRTRARPRPSPPQSPISAGHRHQAINPSTAQEEPFTPISPADIESSGNNDRSISAQSESCPETVGHSVSTAAAEVTISSQEERFLLERFFNTIHSAIPIFSKARFFHHYGNFALSHNLILAMVAITAKLTAYTFAAEGFDVDSQIDSLLSSGTLEGDMLGQAPSLDQFRVACLLAFYEFHQFPGHRAWMRIGDLARMSYRVGLDRLEDLQTRYLDWGSVGEDDLQEWRLVWWCVYRLDSYCNLSSGTPYLIHEDTVYTALIREDQVAGSSPSSTLDQLHLTPEPNDLWKILSSVALDPATSLFNIHIITATALRQVGNASRLRYVRSADKVTARLAEVERSLSAIRLALPAGHLNPHRNAFSNESGSDHHARLVTVLHMLLAQLLVAIPNCFRPGEDGWQTGWQQVLESGQNIASVAEQWDSSFSLEVDPAIAFIAFTALVFLDLHKKSDTRSASGFQSNIEHCQTILLLQLEQFGRMWTLPRLLILSFKGFSESVAGPLSRSQIQYILTRFEAPLHPRWLHFLSSAQTDLELLRSVSA